MVYLLSYSNKSRIDGLLAYSVHLEGVHLSKKKKNVEFSSILESGPILGGKVNDRARQAVFFTPPNLFGNDRDAEEPHFDYTLPQKVHYETYWTRNQDAVYWRKLYRAQHQGLRFWQAKSFAIITYATVPGDCIDLLTSQNGDRVIFERLATPTPAPEITLKR